MLAVASSASAAPAKVHTHKFTGSISCSLTGTITAKPGLLLSTARTVKITVRTTLTGCTGNTTEDGATITGGSGSATITGSYSCTSLTTSAPDPSGEVMWTTTGNNASPTKFTTNTGTFTMGPPVMISYDTTQTESFTGTGSLSAKVHQHFSTLASRCSRTEGLKTINLSSGTMSFSPSAS